MLAQPSCVAFVVFVAVTLSSACGSDRRPGPVDSGTVTDSGSGADAARSVDSGTSTDGGSSDASTTGNLERWRALCSERQTSCDHTGELYDDCIRTGNCYHPWIDAELFSVYIDCIETMGCSSRDDPCANRAFTSAPVTPAGESFAATCETRRTECTGVWGGDSPCIASFASSVDADVLATYAACLTQPCDMIRQCMRDARPAACNG